MNPRLLRIAAVLSCVAVSVSVATAEAPRYQIYDIGRVGSWDALSEAFYISSGGAAVGRSYSYDSGQAFRWTQAGGIVGLPNLGGRAYSAAYGANDQGMTVGAASHTRNGAASAVVWQNGMVSQLPLASGQTSSEATCVNSAGVIGGYVFIPGGQRGCVWNGGAASVITQKARTGSYFLIVYGINDAGRVVGVGRDPSNPSRVIGLVYDLGSTEAVEVGALPNYNGATAESVSNAGHVVGSSGMNQSGGLPYTWTHTTGIVPMPLPAGTQSGSAHGVNSSGWAVGEAYGQFKVPFLYVGSATYNLFDLIPPNHGWSVDNCNQCGVRSINDNGVIVGTALLNQQQTAFAMVPVAIGPLPSAAVSRKTHGTAGNFDVVLPFSGAAGVESRNAAPAGDHQIIVTFPTAVTFTSAAVTVGTGSVASASVSGGAITVNLTGVSDAQTLTLRINGVSNGSQPADVDVRMSILIADANGDRVVNTADALQTRSRSGQATDASNFRSDINVDGFVNSGDVLVVRGRSGNSVP